VWGMGREARTIRPSAGNHGVNSPSGRGPLTLPFPRLPLSPRGLSQHNAPPPLPLSAGTAEGASSDQRPANKGERPLNPSQKSRGDSHPHPAYSFPLQPSGEGSRGPRLGGRGAETQLSPKAANSGTAVRFQEGLPTRPPLHPRLPLGLPATRHTKTTLATPSQWPRYARLAPAPSAPPGVPGGSGPRFPGCHHPGCGPGTHHPDAGLGAGCGDLQASGGPPRLR
jgi:hypothetical protein